MSKLTTFLRYPGSKRRLMYFLAAHLPIADEISGKFIEPFVGGGAIYFFLRPRSATLADVNGELIELYRGISQNPDRVWRLYRQYPTTKRGYKSVRDVDTGKLTLCQRAARTLFLNRTCFKGMWRHNSEGKFNIGYGGQSRRWSITRADLHGISRMLRKASLKCCDFEPIIAAATTDDYMFLDPPYRPGEREQIHQHYCGRTFTFDDHRRLASCLNQADKKGIRWSLTVSGHMDILKLYKKYPHVFIPRGDRSHRRNSGEVLISNCKGQTK